MSFAHGSAATRSLMSVSAPTDSGDLVPVTESNPFTTPIPDGVVDTAGQTLTYTITIVNDGNVDIAGSDIVVTDKFEGTTISVGTLTSSDGDTTTFNHGQTWQYTYAVTVTQDWINNNGGGDGTLDNIATASTISGVLPTTTAPGPSI